MRFPTIVVLVSALAAGCGGASKQPAAGPKPIVSEAPPEEAPADTTPLGAGTGSGGEIGGRRAVSPQVVVGLEEVRGPALETNAIRDVVYGSKGKVQYCYEKELLAVPDLAGMVKIRFTITATGAVSTSEVLESTLDNRKAEECIAAAIATWVFPRPADGGSVVVTYPFMLDPGN
jgi:hypothetical protein